MILFDKESCIDIFCENTNKYVLLAVEDLRKDFAKVNSFGVCPKLVSSKTEHCIIIEDNILADEEAISNEAFSIKSDGNSIRITAKGYLGTIWAIYTFSEKILGIDPCYLFNDYEITAYPELKMEHIDICEKPSGFQFRGVFINDEDLLTGWKDGGGVRYIDAPCYGAVVERSVMDMVVETIMRLKLNLVIPATFIDIDNPSEKMLLDCVDRRGIYLSQHHVEPVGVSSFTFHNYCQKNGIEAKFSYIENQAIMEEVWKYYIDKWAEYDHVVWQTGLRGMGDDRPIWQDDIPSEEVLRRSGALISSALIKQRELIHNATNGKAKYFTSTLWMEGSKLIAANMMDIPKNTIVVFADNGPCQMFGPDFEFVPRERNRDYGIYYHVQYYSCGPHLAPLTGIEKLYYNIKRAYDKGDHTYCILNSSNIREFVFELGAYSEMMWSTVGFSVEDYIEKHTQKYYGEQAVFAEKCIKKYYELIPELDANKFCKHFQKYFNYDFGTDYGKIKNFTAKDGLVIEYGTILIENFFKVCDMELCDEMYRAVRGAITEYEALYKEFHSMLPMADASLQKHIEVKWGCYTYLMLSLYKWYVHLYDAKKACELRQDGVIKDCIHMACESLEQLIEHRRCAEYGVFANWYRGDTKMNIRQLLLNTKRILGKN